MDKFSATSTDGSQNRELVYYASLVLQRTENFWQVLQLLLDHTPAAPTTASEHFTYTLLYLIHIECLTIIIH